MQSALDSQKDTGVHPLIMNLKREHFQENISKEQTECLKTKNALSNRYCAVNHNSFLSELSGWWRVPEALWFTLECSDKKVKHSRQGV